MEIYAETGRRKRKGKSMDRLKKRLQLNNVLAFFMIILLFGLSAVFFDFYYDLNDDVLIKDILSGAYTGTPDAHSIQMLYPISQVICFAYRLLPQIPWQGVFLCAAHGLCFYLIAVKSLRLIQKKANKVLCLVLELVLILTLFLWELIMVQYTVTAGMLAACACFWVFTSPQKESATAFWKEQLPAVLLVILAFNIRSEMLLLMSPFIAFTGIFKWAEEKEIFTKENIKKYLGLVFGIAAGMLLSWIVDMAAYSSPDWQSFRDFFDARTQVYDYTWYPDYEQAEEFYREKGVTPAKWELIDNYNFGLDESVDAELLWDIAEYANNRKAPENFALQIKRTLVQYKWLLFGNVDALYRVFVFAAYGMVLGLAVICRDKSAIWKLPLLFIFRSVPWLYVIRADRIPARISHPLYCMEFILLGAWIFSYLGREKKMAQRGWECCAIILAICAGIGLPRTWDRVEEEMLRRENVNASMEAFAAFTKEHFDNYYYLDVYSSVDYSEKMFQNVEHEQKNYDILGGWASGSPLQKESTQKYQQEAYSRAELLLCDNFYFVVKKGYDTQFLHDFYKTLGIEIELEKVHSVGKETPLLIYKVVPSVNGMMEE